MSSPFIFSGNNAKSLKQNLDLNGVVTILSGSVDPTLTAMPGNKGSIYLSTLTGLTYTKTDAGTTANWTRVVTGAKNYFATSNANPDFESNTVLPWTTFSTVLSNGVPTTVTTGGTGSITIGTNSAAPLSGTYDLAMIKPASNVVGTGFISGVLTIDREDLARVLFGQISYYSNSANIDASGSSTQSLEIWIYNVNGAYWIQPGGYRGMNTNGSPSKVGFNFQTDSLPANNQYRIAIITAQTSALGYAVEFDNFQLGPQTLTTGAAMTDWQAYTPTIAGFGTPTGVNFKSRRVGDSLEVVGYFTSGTSTATPAQIGLGFAGGTGNVVLDTSKVPTFSVVGAGAINVTATTYFSIAPISPSANQSYVYIGVQNSTTSEIGGAANANSLIGSGSQMSVAFQVPIVGWSSNVQQSSDSDQRVVDLAAYNSGVSCAANTNIGGWTATKDSHGAFDGTTYTVKVTGDYDIYFSSSTTTSTTYIPVIFYNGAAFAGGTTGGTRTLAATTIPNCKAGDTITVQLTQALTFGSDTQGTRLSIAKKSGSAVVQRGEDINMRYCGTTGQTVTAGATGTILYNTKSRDSHSQYNPATGVYTINSPGMFDVIASAFTGSASASGNSLLILKNGTQYSNGPYAPQVGGGSTPTVQDSIPCLAGDTIAIGWYNPNAGSIVIATTATGGNFFAVKRVGN